MTRFSALGDLLSSVFDREAWLSAGANGGSLEALCASLMSSKGEASGVARAAEILHGYAALEPDQKLAFFQHLAIYDPDAEAVSRAAQDYAETQSSEALADLFSVAEPPRQELLRRLNMAPGGTGQLVQMRADLLGLLRAHPELKRIDTDFRHLLSSWFNRGFLVLRPIDWQTPAAVLEKIIQYEAVHEIDSWDELRRRVDPPDRRCFAFFHPAMPDEPLIFVEVALTAGIPGSIQGLLSPGRDQVATKEARTAVFYSISNCQAGLAGVSFGAFLIKQVVEDLSRALPRIDTFVTLSPVPGFLRWLRTEAEADPDNAAANMLRDIEKPAWPGEGVDEEKPRLMALAAQYYLDAKRADGLPPDPVARFHLGNGAELAAIHWMGDISAKGMAEGAGLMVNYLYRLDRIEANHEAFAANGEIAASRQVKAARAN